MTYLDDIRSGVLRFRNHVSPQRRALYELLANHQAPQVLFIGCIDSRVDPAELCDADPGDMFVERTPGNIVPSYTETRSGISASIEYAVTALGVTDIIVCGHSDCGALKAVLHPEKLAALPAVERWLHYTDAAAEAAARVGGEDSLKSLCEQNVLAQMRHLRTHPCGAARPGIRIHGWVYQIHTGEVFAADEASGTFALWP
ncbi:MAG: carbonic anhydrase [Acidobacteria bacterium]|nr:carbonic anhydrase [Acidobacteriota bacterium]